MDQDLTLKKTGFLMPAEWQPHSAVWLSWPHDEISFPNRVTKVQSDVVKIIAAIHQSEQVELFVLDDEMQQAASAMLKAAGVDLSKVTFRIATYMDGWMRDCGPIFVKANDGAMH